MFKYLTCVLGKTKPEGSDVTVVRYSNVFCNVIYFFIMFG